MGLFFVLMSTLTYGCYITALNRPVLKRINPDVLTCYVLLFTALFYLIVAVARGKMEIITRPRFLMDMGQLAVLSTIGFCPLASRGRETDRFRDEFRAGNVGADNSNRRGGALF